MDDPLLMGRLEPTRDRHAKLNRLVERQRPAPEHRIERFALYILEHQIVAALGLLKPVDARDVGMVQRRQHPRFTLEANKPVRLIRKMLWQRLDRHLTPKALVHREVHDAHAATPKLAHYLI